MLIATVNSGSASIKLAAFELPDGPPSETAPLRRVAAVRHEGTRLEPAGEGGDVFLFLLQHLTLGLRAQGHHLGAQQWKLGMDPHQVNEGIEPAGDPGARGQGTLGKVRPVEGNENGSHFCHGTSRQGKILRQPGAPAMKQG